MQVKGFSAAAIQAGIRYAGRFDLGLIFSQVPAVTAGAFTTNKVKAAPILLDMERLRSGLAQAILVNSGNANACTGKEGMDVALATGALAAQELGIEESLVQVASTGVIGQQLRTEPFAKAMPGLVANLSEDGFDQLAQAIMTTDLVPKIATATVVIDGVEVSILGVAKGSGMIMPDMATMLCFVVTDARIVFPVLNQLVKSGVEKSFNRITVDGDTSTNDMVLVMANGAAGNTWIDEENQGSCRPVRCGPARRFQRVGVEDCRRRRGRHQAGDYQDHRGSGRGRGHERCPDHCQFGLGQDRLFWRRCQLGPDHRRPGSVGMLF